MMPEMDGLETTGAIRELGYDGPIVALTACAVLGTKELMIAAGMDDYLSKPIILSQLKQILLQWLPAEKQLRPPSTDNEKNGDESKEYSEFWEKVGQIYGLSLSEGLDRVEGQRDVYQQTLKLMIKEIEKCDQNLNGFLAVGDMRGFCIEVHGMKGSLSNMGATELSEKARELEVASGRDDISFCISNLSSFLFDLCEMRMSLTEAFSHIKKDIITKLPPELSPIFSNLTGALREMDIVAIDEGVQKLTALSLSGALGEEIENITDAVMMTDFDYAIEVIQRLTDAA